MMGVMGGIRPGSGLWIWGVIGFDTLGDVLVFPGGEKHFYSVLIATKQ